MHASLAQQVLVAQDIPDQIASAGVNGTVFDMQSWDGILYVFNLGAMASSAVFDARVMSSPNSNFAANSNVTNAAITQVTNAGNTNVVMIDVFRPTDRYLKTVTTPATANTTFGSVGIRYRRTGVLPPTQSATQLVIVAQN